MKRSSRHLKAAFSLLTVCGLLFTGCSTPEPKEETQVDTETLCIITQGRETAVYDNAGNAEYHFKTQRAKRKDAPKTPRTAADTETVKIVLLQGGDIEVTDRTAGRVYTVHGGR